MSGWVERVVVLAVLSTATACSSAGGGGADLGRRVDTLEKDVGKMKTDVDRLTKIEGDLNLMVGRLNEISGDSPAPAAPPRETKSDASAKTPPREAATGGSGVYFASYRTDATAREAWRKLTRKFEDLRSLSPVLFKIDLGKRGTFVRLIAGPYADAGAARSACARYSAGGEECAPAPYSGKPLD